ncbi:MAG: M23 family metallopeptidase [Oligoflexia bacterium]|nr:M23 family metallopeptidase [Oligoflexia bacterium]
MKGGFFAFILCALAIAANGCATARSERSAHRGLFNWGASSVRTTDLSRRTTSRAPSTVNVATASKLKLHWPLKKVQVTSRFGKRPRDFHEGIDLKARSGTPVYAAQAGKVLFAGSKIRGYGKMIVIKHAYDIATVYAHNSRLLVRAGQAVRLGQQIAVSGSTGRSTGPHLHFEVRQGVAAVDPVEMVGYANVAERDVIPDRRHSRRHAAELASTDR